jgi:hypothetical protein
MTDKVTVNQSATEGNDFVPISEHPKGLEIYTFENAASIQIPGTTKLRIALAALVGSSGLFISFYVSLLLGYEEPSISRYDDNSGGGINLIAMMVILVVFLAITWGICFAIFRKTLAIRIKDGVVQVDGKAYDPKHFHGLRYAYDLNFNVSKGGAPIFFGGIGIEYGRWGIVTPLLVDKNMVGQYIVYTNEFINSQLSDPLPEYAPSIGIRKQVF